MPAKGCNRKSVDLSPHLGDESPEPGPRSVNVIKEENDLNSHIDALILGRRSRDSSPRCGERLSDIFAVPPFIKLGHLDGCSDQSFFGCFATLESSHGAATGEDVKSFQVQAVGRPRHLTPVGFQPLKRLFCKAAT